MAVFNVPLTGQTLQNTRAPINDNFNNTDTAFSFDHVPINTGPNSGKHNQVTLPNQATGPATLANEMALYTKLVAGIPQAFLRQNTSGTEINFTSFTAGTPGYTYLPSGMLMQWGQYTVVNPATPIVFSQAFPTACLNVQVTPLNTGGTTAIWVSVSTLTATTCLIQTRLANQMPGNNIPVWILAIGY